MDFLYLGIQYFRYNTLKVAEDYFVHVSEYLSVGLTVFGTKFLIARYTH